MFVNVDEDNQTMNSLCKEQCNKETFMRVMRILRIQRIRNIWTLVHSVSLSEIDPLNGTPESAFTPWNPRRLQKSRVQRSKTLLKVFFRSWYFVPNSTPRFCQICNLVLNVGQLPYHRASWRHREKRRLAYLNSLRNDNGQEQQ